MRIFTIIITLILILSVPFISEISATATQIENTHKIITQQDDKVKVIITFKDTPKTAKDNLFNALGIPQQDPKDKIKNKIKDNGKLKHEFTNLNGISATVTQSMFDELKSDPSILRITKDRPVKAFLSQSIPLINADQAWQQQMQDSGLTGKGTTVCVIDTGIDYTHKDLGNCTLWNLSGNVETYPEESLHPYEDNKTVNWTINYTGFTNISVHFEYIDLEKDFDYIQILDGDDNLIIEYTGDSDDIWSPSVAGDTLKVRLIADIDENASGFVIDKILNGTAIHSWDNCDKVIGGWNFAGDYWNPLDNEGHGTHVAGIVAANGTINGVAPDTKLIAMKVLDRYGSGYSSDVLAGMDWCISNASVYNISVISMSLGGDTIYSTYCDGGDSDYATLIDEAVSKNISVVVATGNDANGAGVSSPACIENAIRVGATYDADVGAMGYNYPNESLMCSDSDTFADKLTCYTNRGINFFDMLLAPGGATYSTSLDNAYLTRHGTSMATPHVSGAITILIQAYQDRFGNPPTPAYIENILNRTGEPVYDVGTGLYFSRIDVLTAVLYINTPPNITDIYNNITDNNSKTITVNETDSILFNLTVSAPVNYTWKKNGTVVGANQPNWTFDTNYNYSGFWTVEAIVNNDNGTRTTHWNVTIINKNRAPIITSISNITMELQSQTSINISTNISDPDNDTLTITTDDPGNITVENHTLIFHYTETITNKQVTITVNDSDLTTNITITVNITDTLINITDTYNNVTGDNSSTLTINETDSAFFNISTDISVNYTWYINNIEIENNFNNYTLTTDFDDAGTTNISVNVSTDNNSNIFQWTITILNTNRPPTITSISNITMELQSQISINISQNISDPDNDTLIITTDDSENITVENHTLIFNYTEIVTNKQVTITVNDSELTTNKTIYINITDTTAPTITINSPTNKTYNTTSINISIHADELLNWCAYSLNAQSNITMNCTGNNTLTATENQNNLTVWANDTNGNLNHTDIFFTVDTISPNITLTASNYTTNDYLYINISISEIPDTCILNWQGENITMNKNETACYINQTSINPGIYNYTIYVNDTGGNVNSTSDLQTEFYYCFVSVTDWSSCVSSSRTRTHTNRDCTSYTETESCYSGGGGGSFSYIPPVTDDVNATASNITLNETLNITEPLDNVSLNITDQASNETAEYLGSNETQTDDTTNTTDNKSYKNDNHKSTTSNIETKDLESVNGGFLGIALFDNILSENGVFSKIKDKLHTGSTTDNTFSYILLLFIVIVIVILIIKYYNNRQSHQKHIDTNLQCLSGKINDNTSQNIKMTKFNLYRGHLYSPLTKYLFKQHKTK